MTILNLHSLAATFPAAEPRLGEEGNELLAFGLDGQQFRADYFEKNFYLRKRALRVPLLAWSDLDELLYEIEPGEPAVQLFNQGPVPEPAYIEECVEFGQRRRRLNKAHFYGQMRAGATMVINRFENHCRAARRLCSEVSAFAGLQTMSNAYLSFGGRGTFGKHWDTHDVYAIQLIGRKRWQVFAPTFALPLSHQTSDRASPDGLGAPVLDCVLEAGDMLYLPRGWWHQTIPLEQGSLHLSVGAYAATLYDYFMWACARQLPALPSARRALPDTGGRAAIDEMLQNLGPVLRDPSVWEAFQIDLGQRMRSRSEFHVGLFLDSASPRLQGSALIRLNGSCQRGADSGEICVHGATLRLDPTSRTVVSILCSAALTFDALCARLSHIPRTILERAVLDLAQHEAVLIEE